MTGLMDRLIFRSLKSHLPLNAHFDITYRCNERCVHCYLDHEDHGEMTTSEVKGVLDQLRAAGTLFLTFSGGEVFLRKDFFELLAYARQLHFDVCLKTNGVLIDAVRAHRLKEMGVRKVQISIYSGRPEVHDAITKLPGSFTRSIAAVKFLKQQGLQAAIACPIMPQNVADYRQVVDLAAELGVTYLLDLTITPKIDGDRAPLALREDSRNLLPILTDPVVNTKHSKGEDSEPEEFSDPCYDIPCSAGHNSCYISPYGDVTACVQLPVAAGNLRRHSFHDIWYGSRELRHLRDLHDSEVPICSTCSIRKFCQRCPGLALMEAGDAEGPYERACELAETNARLAGVAHPVSAYHLLRSSGGTVHSAHGGAAAVTKSKLITIASAVDLQLNRQ